MANIHIKKNHRLDPETIHNKVQELADKLAKDLSAEYKWEKNNLVFKRSGASGIVRIGEQQVEVEVKLGLMLSPLKGSIEKSITEYLDKKLV